MGAVGNTERWPYIGKRPVEVRTVGGMDTDVIVTVGALRRTSRVKGIGPGAVMSGLDAVNDWAQRRAEQGDL